jgi:hypothetical protein
LLLLTIAPVCVYRVSCVVRNDKRITDTNPTLNLGPDPIVIVMLNYANEANNAGSKLCTKVDPGWASAPGLGITSVPAIPDPVMRITAAQGGNGLASTIVDTPFTFGWGGVSTMATITSLRNVALINQAGRTVNPTAASQSQAFLEMAALGFIADGSGFDLTNPQSAYAWPISASAWLLMDSERAQSTCASKKAVLQFVLWFYTSEVVVELAASAGLAALPSLYLADTGLLTRIGREMLCDGSELVATDTTTARFQGNAMVAANMGLFTQLYQAIDQSYTYMFEPSTDSMALTRVAAGEIDFAIVSTAALKNAEIDEFTASYVDPSALLVGCDLHAAG